MTRDEVLSQLDSVANSAFAGSVVSADVCRAAAEIIRAGGWRPIAEALSVIPPGRLGWWGTEKWYEVVTQYPIPKLNASTLGYTHYCPLDKPAPPAREVENG